MEAHIFTEETEGAIYALKANTVPGLDGYTTEFYKRFSNKLALHLQKLFYTCLKDNTIPDTWRETKIIVILKQGKDLTHPQSYRPIALLNIDYKILTTIYAIRLNNS